MADAVTSQTIFDGPTRTVMKFTNVSDGTGESAVLKVDVSELNGAPSRVRIMQVWFTCDGMSVDMFWDATSDVLAFSLPQTQNGHLDFRCFGGIPNNAGSGITGDLMFTTVGHTSGDRYSIVLELAKN